MTSARSVCDFEPGIKTDPDNVDFVTTNLMALSPR
jgi:hypothetical protein